MKRKRHSRRTFGLFVTACVAGTVTAASPASASPARPEPSATRPADDRPDRDDGFDEWGRWERAIQGWRGDRGDGRRGDGRYGGERGERGERGEWREAMRRAQDPQTRRAAAEFWMRYSPYRVSRWAEARVAASTPADVAEVGRMEEHMLRRYLMLDGLSRRQNTQLYDMALERLSAEDEVARLRDEYAAADGDETREEARRALRQAVGRIVDVNLAERDARIDGLRRTLARLEEQTAEDRARREELVDERVDRVVAD